MNIKASAVMWFSSAASLFSTLESPNSSLSIPVQSATNQKQSCWWVISYREQQVVVEQQSVKELRRPLQVHHGPFSLFTPAELWLNSQSEHQLLMSHLLLGTDLNLRPEPETWIWLCLNTAGWIFLCLIAASCDLYCVLYTAGGKLWYEVLQ